MEIWGRWDAREAARRSLFSFTLCLCVVLAPVGDTPAYGDVGAQTDTVRAGLVGPVQTVSVATSFITTDTEDFPDGQRAVTTYDRQGRELETAYHDLGGTSVYARTVSVYDSQGRKTAELHYEGGGQSPRCTMAYSYDAQGQLVRKEPRAGWCSGATTYSYDAQGRLLEEATEGHGRTVFTYDAQGRLRESTNFDPHDAGLGIEKVVASYDAQGTVWQLTTYYTHKVGEEDDRPIPPPNKELYTYEYDNRGNWVVQDSFLCTPNAVTGAYQCSLERRVRRFITYYAEG